AEAQPPGPALARDVPRSRAVARPHCGRRFPGSNGIFAADRSPGGANRVAASRTAGGGKRGREAHSSSADFPGDIQNACASEPEGNCRAMNIEPTNAAVGIIMGSRSDWETMKHAADVLEELDIACDIQVVSAHRTPDLLFEYAATAI